MAFTEKFLDQIKKKLLAEKDHIKKELLGDTTTQTDKGQEITFPQYGDHVGENASEVASFDNELATNNILKKTLRDIDDALKRISAGKYGVCKYCGKEINPKRLEARPTSSACIDCKNKFSRH